MGHKGQADQYEGGHHGHRSGDQGAGEAAEAVLRHEVEEIEQLDPDDRHYNRRKADLDDRLYRMYDKIDDQEQSLIEARAKNNPSSLKRLPGITSTRS